MNSFFTPKNKIVEDPFPFSIYDWLVRGTVRPMVDSRFHVHRAEDFKIKLKNLKWEFFFDALLEAMEEDFLLSREDNLVHEVMITHIECQRCDFY